MKNESLLAVVTKPSGISCKLLAAESNSMLLRNSTDGLINRSQPHFRTTSRVKDRAQEQSQPLTLR